MLDPDFITIFTPAYNRGDLMSQLYASLLAQAPIPFEWIIVDDGSTDDTCAVVAAFIAENKIPISYYYKENGGKHTAINLGVQKAKGAFFVLIDSDDYFALNALNVLYEKWNNIRDNFKIAGIIGLSQDAAGSIVGDVFLKNDWQLSFADFYLKYHLTGDKSVAFKTSVLKAYPFPEQIGIPFVFEAVVWHELSKKYDVLAVNTVIQNINYLDSGLSDSSYKKWYIRSLAFSYFYLIKNNTHPFLKYPKTYLWDFIYLVINSLLSGTSYFYQLPSIQAKCLYLILFPRGYLSFLKMRKLIRD